MDFGGFGLVFGGGFWGRRGEEGGEGKGHGKRIERMKDCGGKT